LIELATAAAAFDFWINHISITIQHKSDNNTTLLTIQYRWIGRLAPTNADHSSRSTPASSTTWDTTWDTAWDTTWDTAWDTTWDTAWDTTWDTAWDTTWDTVS
jgi:hypothetical protein